MAEYSHEVTDVAFDDPLSDEEYAMGGLAGPDPEPAAYSECPDCGRVMSKREAIEQGLCNDCNGGPC